MPSSAPTPVLLDASGRPRDPLPAETAPLSREQRGEDDRLEPPGLRTPVIVAVAAGLLVFIATALALLLLFFKLELGSPAVPPPRTFPTPRLETNINPRVLPATLPGPAQAFPAVVPQAAGQPLDQAMATIAARGAHAYDPLPEGVTAAPAVKSGGGR